MTPYLSRIWSGPLSTRWIPCFASGKMAMQTKGLARRACSFILLIGAGRLFAPEARHLPRGERACCYCLACFEGPVLAKGLWCGRLLLFWFGSLFVSLKLPKNPCSVLLSKHFPSTKCNLDLLCRDRPRAMTPASARRYRCRVTEHAPPLTSDSKMGELYTASPRATASRAVTFKRSWNSSLVSP